MKVHVSDPTLVDVLVDAICGTSCDAVRTGELTLEIRQGWATEMGGEYELDGFLRAWEAVHPGVDAKRTG